MLFYFSATGITKKLAQIISSRIDEEAIDIESELKTGKCTYTLKNGERLGFLSPVYFGAIPPIVQDFIDKLQIQTASNYYGYIALTYGADGYYAPNRFVQVLLKRGLTTSAVFGIQGIDTFLPLFSIPYGDKRTKIEDRWQLEADFISEQIADRTISTQLKRGPFPWLTSALMHPIYRVMNKTERFSISDACTSCGLCAQNCPQQAISLENGTPKWIKPECMLCFRCLHRCPSEAINYGQSTQGKLRYKPSNAH